MNIAAMLEPTQVAPYPYTASASPPSPLEPRLQQRLPSITHVTSNLHNQQHQLQPLSAQNMHQHAHSMPQPLSSLPPSRQVLPPRVDSMSSVNSSNQGSVEHTPQPNAPLSSHRPRKNSTARRDSSASSSHTNQHQRRRPGGQTKAACLPCRKRKSKCDGARPSCKCCTAKATSCNYSVTTPGVTQQQAIKNELDAYKRVLALIRDSSSTDIESFVRIIKGRENLNDAVQDIHTMTTRQNIDGGI